MIMRYVNPHFTYLHHWFRDKDVRLIRNLCYVFTEVLFQDRWKNNATRVPAKPGSSRKRLLIWRLIG